MGQTVTIGMQGTLALSLDGSPMPRPLEVDIGGLEVDLAHLMERGLLTMHDKDPSKVRIRLEGVTLTFVMGAEELLSRGGAAIVDELEELL